MFVEMYSKNLGAQYRNDEIIGNGWKAKVIYRKAFVGSLELTETEMRFEGDEQAANEFLTNFRAVSLRNWG
jgi:hypothetical protein